MIAVSDTSPIVNLAQTNRLDLLPMLYGDVVIPATGLLGVLLKAKQQGLLPSLKANLAALARHTTFYCSETLAERVLREAGE